MARAGSVPTGMLIRTRTFPLSFLLLLFKTNVTIDGATSVLTWGEHFFAAPPGVHEVTVSFRYFFSRRMGVASLKAEVVPGAVTRVSYRAPLLVFLGGSIEVVES